MPDQQGNLLPTDRRDVTGIVLRSMQDEEFDLSLIRDEDLLYDGPPVADEDVLSVYVVLNGALGMSPGKVAAQAFHCGYLRALAFDGSPENAWIQQGRRVVVRVAETEHVFSRVVAECDGYEQRDEGLTEVERGAVTAFVTLPYRRDSVPKILAHKKCQLYGG
jgi:peptidyl-tRNA hydrolase